MLSFFASRQLWELFFELVGTGEVVLQGEEENAPRVLGVMSEAEFGLKNARMRANARIPAFSMAENPPNRPPGRLQRPGRLQAPPGAAESCRPPREMWQAAKEYHKPHSRTKIRAPGACNTRFCEIYSPLSYIKDAPGDLRRSGRPARATNAAGSAAGAKYVS